MNCLGYLPVMQNHVGSAIYRQLLCRKRAIEANDTLVLQRIGLCPYAFTIQKPDCVHNLEETNMYDGGNHRGLPLQDCHYQ